MNETPSLISSVVNNGENNNRRMGHITHLRNSSNQLHHNFTQDCSVSSLVEIGSVVRSREEVENVKSLQTDG